MRGESPDLPGGTILVDTIETTMRTALPDQVQFYIEVIDTGRYRVEAYDERFGQLLADKYRDIPIDLVIAFTEPAVQFVLRERPLLFPRAPLLLGLVEPRLFDAQALPPRSSVVYVHVGVAETVRLIRRVSPGVHRLLVVGGRSRFDRGWERVVREDLRPFESSIPIAYDFDSTLDDLVRRVATLPSDAAVLYVSMTRDSANQPVRPVDGLARLRAAATVPIFGVSSTYMGYGIVGGVVLDFDRHGDDLARQAVRMLGGDIPPPMTTPAKAVADARELQRFQIAASRLPPSTAIAFREPGIWETQKTTILTAGSVVLAQALLIVALVRAGRRRRETQQQLVERLRFEQALSEFSVAMVPLLPSDLSVDLDPALQGLASALGLDTVLRWRLDDWRDQSWDSAALCAGQSATFDSRAALPPSLQEQLRPASAPVCRACAVPLVANGRTRGALFWISLSDATEWPRYVDQLKVVAAVVASILQRKQAQVALEGSNLLKSAILDSLPAQIAVLDREGVVIAVNDAWSRFASDNDGEAAPVGLGTDYLRVCREAVREGSAGAQDIVDVIERACRGEWTGRPVEYRYNTRHADRWFVMTAEPLRRSEGGAVVTHWEITARKQNEIALRESEDRFRRLADALPVAIWMSDVEGGCTYFNRGWLDLTGRTLDEEYGDGWLEGVHVADRAACMDAYLRAFHVREPFRAEYRLRRHDGEYRWLIDYGVPRYGTDGAFHGYVGGCLDITDSKNAEQALRGLTHRLMNAQDDERRRIARDLHDHLSQQLALLAIDLQQLSMQRPASTEALTTALQEAWRRTTEIASDVHAISHRLHPAKMEALGLVATMRAHCREISRQSLVVEFLDQDVPSGIPPDRALSLFRVLEEALGNIVHHSGARSAQVALAGTDGSVMLRVADDGRGFDVAEASNGLGLISMRERVQSMDGTLTFSSTPGRGTVIEVRVPILHSPVPARSLQWEA